MVKMSRAIALGCATISAFAAVNAQAAEQVQTSFKAFVEKSVASSDGTTKLVLAEPQKVFPGDKIVYVLSYRNAGGAPATNFAITDPIPGPLVFESTPDATALVSVDGGKSWGNLATLKVAGANGLRAARPEDVTHVRWMLRGVVPAGGEGKLSFRATVK